MENWIPLTDKELKYAWKTFDQEFKFNPSISRFPGFQAPSPYITYDISAYFEDPSLLSADEDLEKKALLSFQENITGTGEYMQVLDWQHECYWITPYGSFEKDEFGEWRVPVLPNGDYYFFLSKEMTWGLLGHPWEQSITIFGEGLIDSFTRHRPLLFQRKIREG
ncbi:MULTISPECIES: DUF2716 domain-containing protein [Bacillus]|uniref:DUF2716 domain-containing protein n=1 Tax=Bacillus TaxID=1386 RepID=UPI0006250B24|nr:MULTISPECIES: DUF2716 domain-containing protein [Bacillus]MBY0188253.1 DUF2716 domain-containing protein [Bacillus aerophilus]AMB89046.1 sugar epimerase [Bacillus altitudinis]KKK10394.1 bifunctional nucleotide sugar epimerase hydrolase [Bacillus sp. L_1B0_12]MCA0117783.1 DUF2716 domain-containing protein [Bacillus sp. RSS_NA_20]MEC1011864.1 DUF2716 domain-containing protein [Bacillus altitudinis]